MLVRRGVGYLAAGDRTDDRWAGNMMPNVGEEEGLVTLQQESEEHDAECWREEGGWLPCSRRVGNMMLNVGERRGWQGT